MHGGDRIASVLKSHGIEYLFTLCGGHISPLLVGCKKLGIRVIDVRHEATAVYAADGVARLKGVPGVAAVTAGPGVTNTLTAIKNAELAQSPLVLFGGATATALKNRGALQDIDQMALMKPHVKWAVSVKRVKDLIPIVENAFRIAKEGVPGPVFVEVPVDLLYEESLVREWYGLKTGDSGSGKSLTGKAIQLYLDRHVNKLFEGAEEFSADFKSAEAEIPEPLDARIRHTVDRLKSAEKPVMLIGSQAMLDPKNIDKLVTAVNKLNIPVYLSGMARGLLGGNHRLLMRHKRRNALREADLVILAGVPMDFRLDYGNHIRKSATLISVNRSRKDMTKNRKPDLGILGDASLFLRKMAGDMPENLHWNDWILQLRERDNQRETEIQKTANQKTDDINPLQLCAEIENQAEPNRVFVADGGDFVATASYIVNPASPLRWLDPGVFGTLGVGGGFAIAAKLVYPDSEIWLLYGDGSAGYSIAEFDTYVRHNLPIIAVVGNDAGWTQIAREQIDILKDDVGTVLRQTDYHKVAAGFGGKGFLLNDPEKISETIKKAKAAAKSGHPVLINAHLGKTDFRKGSISM
ncbi:MAG: thiamine pyrophosphate-binding protein [Calditrichia bacterium]